MNNFKDENPDIYRLMIEEIEDYAILVLDERGNVQSWNKGAEKIKGYKREEIIGKNFRIFYTPEDREKKLPETLIEIATGTGNAKGEGWRMRKDNSLFWGSILITPIRDQNNNIIGFSKVTRDLSDKKKAEDAENALKQSKKGLLSLFNASPSGMILTETTSGKMLEVNDSFLSTFGFKRDECLGRTSDELGFASQETQLLFFSKLKEQGFLKNEEIPCLNSKGEVVHTLFSVEPFEMDGQPAFLCIFNDISNRKEMERKVIESDRLKSEFLASMSHELRTPMNAILGFSEILIDKKVGELNDKQLEYLKDIHASGAHLLQLINDVLDLSKIESGKKELRPESFLLKDIVEEIISVLAPLAIKNGIRIRTDLSPEVKNVWADKRQFRQILYNLVSNAIKFNVTGGSILISMSLSGLEHFKLTVGDTGIGIAPEGLRKLFMPFAQLHAPSSGAIESTGLGLTLTKTIVEHHHGTIKVESIPGKGSVFIVTLPINTPRQAPGHA